MAASRMHDQAGRLIDHNNVGVLVKNLQGDVLGLERRGNWGRHIDFDPFAGADVTAGDHRRPSIRTCP